MEGIAAWLLDHTMGAVLGGVLGLLAKPIWEKTVFVLPSESARQIVGDWYGYYLIICEQQVQMKDEKLSIAKDYLRGRFLVKGERPIPSGNPGQTNEQKYSGELWEEGSYLIIHMHPAAHKEDIFIRFNNPIVGGDPIKYGLWSALDFDSKPAVGPMILSRKQLENPRKMLDLKLAQFKVEASSRIMQIFY